MIRVSTYNSEVGVLLSALSFFFIYKAIEMMKRMLNQYLRPGLYLDEKDPTTLKGGYGEKIHSLVNAIFGPK